MVISGKKMANETNKIIEQFGLYWPLGPRRAFPQHKPVPFFRELLPRHSLGHSLPAHKPFFLCFFPVNKHQGGDISKYLCLQHIAELLVQLVNNGMRSEYLFYNLHYDHISLRNSCCNNCLSRCLMLSADLSSLFSLASHQTISFLCHRPPPLRSFTWMMLNAHPVSAAVPLTVNGLFWFPSLKWLFIIPTHHLFSHFIYHNTILLDVCILLRFSLVVSTLRIKLLKKKNYFTGHCCIPGI